MEVVNQVRIGIRFEEKHLVKSRPAMSAGDDRMVRRAGPNRGNEFRLYAVPAKTILNHRLIEHLEEDGVRASLRQVCSERPPESSKCFNAALVTIHPQLTLVARMDIDDHCQTSSQNHIECSVDISEISAVENRGIRCSAKKRCRLNWQPYVVETHGLDERDVLRRSMGFEVRL